MRIILLIEILSNFGKGVNFIYLWYIKSKDQSPDILLLFELWKDTHFAVAFFNENCNQIEFDVGAEGH